MANQAPNPSFEADTSEWAVSGAGNTSSHFTTDAFDGTACARLTGTGTANRTWEMTNNLLIPASPGQVWSAGAYGKASNGTPHHLRADIRWRDAAGVALSAAQGANTVMNSSTWTRAIVEGATAPANTAFATLRVVYLTSIVANDATPVDAVQIEQGATLPAFNIPSPVPPGNAGDTLRESMNRLAGTTGLDEKLAANLWAGTVGLDLKGALNIKAGTSGLEQNLVLNILAGTTGLGEQEAARSIEGA